MKPLDTDSQAQEVLIRLIRRKSFAQKIQDIFDAYHTGQQLAMAGIRQRYAQATEQEVWNMWARQHLGNSLYEQVYGKS